MVTSFWQGETGTYQLMVQEVGAAPAAEPGDREGGQAHLERKLGEGWPAVGESHGAKSREGGLP